MCCVSLNEELVTSLLLSLTSVYMYIHTIVLDMVCPPYPIIIIHGLIEALKKDNTTQHTLIPRQLMHITVLSIRPLTFPLSTSDLGQTLH